MPTTLITGGAGYIGSHMTYALVDRGEDVVVLDNLSTGIRQQVSPKAKFVEGDVGDQVLVQSLIEKFAVDAVVHFAGSIVVPESVENPLFYYRNNTAASRSLIEACVRTGVEKFVFSSTAAVYGSPEASIVSEAAPTKPINPYGVSKLMTEWMLADCAHAYDFRYIALRYFNVAGADPAGRTGQSTPRATHLIKQACQVGLGRASHLDIFGTDYPTPDGTGVRDYIHVSDLIAAHLLALDALHSGGPSNTFNCGYGQGFSVRQVVGAVEHLIGRKIAIREAGRRSGDPAILVADPAKLKAHLNWNPQFANLNEIVRTALNWENSLSPAARPIISS